MTFPLLIVGRRWSLLAVVMSVLHGCHAAPERPAPPDAEARVPWEIYEQIDASQGRVFRLEPDASEVRLYVYRAGPLAARGHNHVITAPALDGAMFVPTDGAEAARFDLVIPVDQLEVDDPEVRRSLGYSFGSEVTDDARAGTRANMLGPDVLDAGRFPSIAVASGAVTGELPKLAISVAVTLRGITRERLVPVDVQVDRDRLVARGALAVRQSDFDMEPFSALGGLLRVADAVVIEFRLVGSPR
jgi:polyisoprenoid-binding protein YceI